MKFYYYPISTYSQKVLLALYEKQVVFEPQLVNILDSQQVEEFRVIYPLGKIPVLVTENQQLIPESTIIIEYLDSHFDSGTRLIPAGNSDENRQLRLLDRIADLYLNDSIVTLMFAQNCQQAEIDNAKRYLIYCYQQFNGLLEGNSWVMGQGFTLVDCALIPPLLYAERFMPFADYEHLHSYFQRAQERPSYQKVLADALPMLTSLGI
ncbi:glutathione S-transferase family protein [Thalassotalea mangrovi]|uniref:Glutathione S-transferase family protein n=1 Tax=Thalassotalea mangrovi TaxID=2572245 RepID=A0A4U1B5C1_9GAMM|nr:glutathione S-transferase family protein [Thalassotalea mangrovi]TKB45499.1 glutathione S-transferase family protein [Thalassotalea mangrovi]